MKPSFIYSVLLLATSVIAQRAFAVGVDFSYAFSTPHRITVAPPDSGDKTLLDVEPGVLRMLWSYDSLATYPYGAFMTPPANWSVKLLPQIEDRPFAESSWTRSEGYLPQLLNTYKDPQGEMTLEVTGAAIAAIVKVTLRNTDTQKRRFGLICESQRGFFGYNPGYVDADAPRDHLLAGWGERADRVIAAVVGADELTLSSATSLNAFWELEAGQTKTAWLIRPYRAYAEDMPLLRTEHWDTESEKAKQEWRNLLGRATRIHVPDKEVERAFYACLADCFVMREPVPGGKICGAPGTDGYRAASPCETAIIAIVLDQMGLHKESTDGYNVCFEAQGRDGNWSDPQGWAHLMWLAAGFKSWAAMEHYRLTRDLGYLEWVYPRMLASSRFNESQRARTRVMVDGQRPLTYGLMPRGMGDCGLKDGEDLYGVFLPHNFWSVYADGVTLEAARILGKNDNLAELSRIYETALSDLREATEKGAIPDAGGAWIPAVPGKTSGSRWGALNALTPCNILPSEHPLIEGTLRYLESNMSAGGLPLNTGWLSDGLWVAIALDNLAETHLLRNEGDAAAALFYATLNHGTPLFTWCEERSPEPAAQKCTGDRQHLWTPVAVVRCLRDMLVMEDGKTLHLARGVHRDWLASGESLGVENARTHFGSISYTLSFDTEKKVLKGKVQFPTDGVPKAVLHLRLPENLRALSVGEGCDAQIIDSGAAIQWDSPKGEVLVNVSLGL